MNKEGLQKQLEELGIEKEEFEQAWQNSCQKAREDGIAEKEVEAGALVTTRRYYRKVLRTPSVLYENQTYLGSSNLTDWAEIGRRNRDQPQGVQPQDMVYMAGMNQGNPIPKHEYAKTYYFMSEQGDVYGIASRVRIKWEIDPAEEKALTTNNLPELQFGKKYRFRVVEQTSNTGNVRRTLPSYAKFTVCGEAAREDIIKQFKTLKLVDVFNMPDLPEAFIIDVDIVDITEGANRDTVLVEDDSIVEDLTANYSVFFDKGAFRVHQDGRALIIVRPTYNRTGEFVGFEGLGYFSDDVVETEKLSEEDWVSGGGENAGA